MANINDIKTIAAIAEKFDELVRIELGPDYDVAVARNRAEGDPNVCHTHDFCDANMVMAEAFKAVTGREVEVDSDEDCALWSTAWNAWFKEACK